MIDLTIRRAGPPDTAAVVALFDATATWLGPSGTTRWRPGQVSSERVEHWMATGRLYVGMHTGTVVGTVRLAWDDPAVWGEQPPEAGYVHSLVTARSVAGHGVGRRLLGHAESVVRASGRPLVRLDHVARNPRLAAYYTAAGYAVVGHRDFAPESGHDDVVLREKRLS